MNPLEHRVLLANLDKAKECLNALEIRLDEAVKKHDWEMAAEYRSQIPNVLRIIDDVRAKLGVSSID
jgi:protein-arginine kinase activator protein McsA